MSGKKTRPDLAEAMDKISEEYKKGISLAENYRQSAGRRKVTTDGKDERTLEAIGKNEQAKKLAEIFEETHRKILKIFNEFKLADFNFFALDGADLTDDEKLLALVLTAEQVQNLQNRYADNPTMLKLINDYARQKNYPEKHITPTAEESAEKLSLFANSLEPRARDEIFANPEKMNLDFDEIAEKYKQKFLS